MAKAAHATVKGREGVCVGCRGGERVCVLQGVSVQLHYWMWLEASPELTPVLHRCAACRPLLFYMLTELVAVWGHVQLGRRGFKRVASSSRASYYVKQADPAGELARAALHPVQAPN